MKALFSWRILGRPNISASLITLASPGDDVVLECKVDAHPTPMLSFTRDSDGLDKIRNDSKYQVNILRENKVISFSLSNNFWINFKKSFVSFVHSGTGCQLYYAINHKKYGIF